MSDNVRKDLDTKVKEAIIPDATKSRVEKIEEATTESADRVARDAEPDSNKSVTQKLADKTGRAEDNVVHGSTHESIGDKVKHALHMDKSSGTTGHSSSVGPKSI